MGYTTQDTQKMVYQVVDAMVESFQEGNVVTMQNFGSFEVKKKMERIIVNPTTGQRMLVPPKLTVVFKPVAATKERVRKGGNGNG